MKQDFWQELLKILQTFFPSHESATARHLLFLWHHKLPDIINEEYHYNAETPLFSGQPLLNANYRECICITNLKLKYLEKLFFRFPLLRQPISADRQLYRQKPPSRKHFCLKPPITDLWHFDKLAGLSGFFRLQPTSPCSALQFQLMICRESELQFLSDGLLTPMLNYLTAL